VGLQLQHVLAGVAVRAGEVQRQPLVDGLALRVAKRQVGGLAGLEGAAAQRLHQGLQPFARHPHDADGPAPWGGGDGDDGIVVACKHGGS